jgi:RHS repeat-associated protein
MSSTTCSATISPAPTAGETIWFAAVWGNSGGTPSTITSVKDAAGNSFTISPNSPNTAYYSSGTGGTALAYMLSAPSNITNPITITFASSTHVASCFADSFQVASGYTAVFDSDAQGSAATGNANAPSITPSATDVFYSAVNPDNNVTSVNSPWNMAGGGITSGGVAAGWDTNVTSALAVNMTVSPSGPWNSMEGAIKASSGGGGGGITVSVSPSSYNLSASQTGQFSATVTGSSNQNVTWSINPSVGFISSSGSYTAPDSISNNQTVTVTATSQANSSATGSAAVNLTASSGSSVYYYVDDQLGTSRVITTSNGTVCYDADFYPFGGERPYTDSCPPNYKFTSKERDLESNLDYFGARHFTSSLGRFMSPDPIGIFVADPSTPQSWNLYAYVRNNPLNLLDPFGLYCVDPTGENEPGEINDADVCAVFGFVWIDSAPTETVEVTATPCTAADVSECDALSYWLPPTASVPLPSLLPMSTLTECFFALASPCDGANGAPSLPTSNIIDEQYNELQACKRQVDQGLLNNAEEVSNVADANHIEDPLGGPLGPDTLYPGGGNPALPIGDSTRDIWYVLLGGPSKREYEQAMQACADQYPFAALHP